MRQPQSPVVVGQVWVAGTKLECSLHRRNCSLRLTEEDARHGAPSSESDLARVSVIGWSEATQGIKAARWLSEMIPRESIVYRTSSLVNQLTAVKSSMGVAVLPCYLADPEPGLQRVLAPIPAITTELWLITHKALKDTARVRAFMDYVGDGIRRALPLLAQAAPPVRGEAGAA
jgi:DNA-binding transcriptional LysR family regulator